MVRGRVEPPTFRFSGQRRRALCEPAETVVTDKRHRARRKVQCPPSRTPDVPRPPGRIAPPTQYHRDRRRRDHGHPSRCVEVRPVRSVPTPRTTRCIPASQRLSKERRQPSNPIMRSAHCALRMRRPRVWPVTSASRRCAPALSSGHVQGISRRRQTSLNTALRPK